MNALRLSLSSGHCCIQSSKRSETRTNNRVHHSLVSHLRSHAQACPGTTLHTRVLVHVYIHCTHLGQHMQRKTRNHFWDVRTYIHIHVYGSPQRVMASGHTTPYWLVTKYALCLHAGTLNVVQTYCTHAYYVAMYALDLIVHT